MAKKPFTVILVFITSGLFVAGVIFGANKKEFINTPSGIVEAQSYTKTSSMDTDGDGLYDWEEDLWKTDKTKADTDRDGTGDGIEVKSGRNPLVAGPNDTQSQTTLSTPQKTSDADKNLTPTDKLGREMLGEYLAMKKSGVTFDAKTTDDFVNNLIQKNVGDFSYKIYTQNDLDVQSADDGVAIKKYGNGLGQIVLNNADPHENELIIFGRYMDMEDKGKLKKLDPIIQTYHSMLKETLALLIPKSAADVHLAFINSLSLTIASLESMRKAEHDNFILLVTFNRHLASAATLKQSITDLKEYLKNKNVDFTKEESGYVLTHEL